MAFNALLLNIKTGEKRAELADKEAKKPGRGSKYGLASLVPVVKGPTNKSQNECGNTPSFKIFDLYCSDLLKILFNK